MTGTTFAKNDWFLFKGGVIIVSNSPLMHSPELVALKTRIPSIELRPGDDEIRSMMRSTALKGHRRGEYVLEPEKCMVVCDYLIAELKKLHRHLDLRLVKQAFADYVQWEPGETGTHWKELVAAQVREGQIAFRERVNVGARAERVKGEIEIACQIAASTEDGDEHLDKWVERTGKSKATFYRRLQEARTSDTQFR